MDMRDYWNLVTKFSNHVKWGTQIQREEMFPSDLVCPSDLNWTPLEPKDGRARITRNKFPIFFCGIGINRGGWVSRREKLLFCVHHDDLIAFYGKYIVDISGDF